MENDLPDLVRHLILTSFSMERGEKEKLLLQLPELNEAKLTQLHDKLVAEKQNNEEKLKNLSPDVLIQLKQQICGIKVKNISSAGEDAQMQDAQNAENFLADELSKIEREQER